jgi:hypothetical protein
MSNEAWFYFNGFVNAQDTHHWGIENPHTIHEAPLHDWKLDAWCAVSGQRIISYNYTIIPTSSISKAT